MKKLLTLFFVLSFLPVVLADVRIDSIKGYLNNERVSDIDEDGGDFGGVIKGDGIDLVIKIENTENETIEVRLDSVLENIDNGDDIEEDEPWYEIDEDDNKAKTLSYSIPSDTNNDDYDLKLDIRYRYANGTEESFDKIKYTVIVEEEKIIEEIEKINMSGILYNMTYSCDAIANSSHSLIETTSNCFEYVGRFDNCSAELSTVKEERGTFKQQTEDITSSLEICRSDIAEVEREKTDVDNQMKGMLTQQDCTAQTTTAVVEARKENDSKFNQSIGMIAVLALGFWWWQNKKKSKGTVADSYYYDKQG